MAAGTQHLNREHSHLPFLDGLRGLMAFWVLAGHVTFITGIVLPVVSREQIAVDVFMFVSGFLMAYYFRIRQDREPWEAPRTWWEFYVRRFFRIAPAYYFCLLFALLFQAHVQAAIFQILSRYWPGQFQALPMLAPVTWKNILAHLSFSYGFFPQYAASNALPDWSIGLEMQFYLALPFIMLLYRRAGYVVATGLSIAAWVAATHLIGVYLNTPAKPLGHFPQPTLLPLRLNHFVIGILLAESYYHQGRDRGKSLLLFLCSAGLALATSSKILTSVVCLSALQMIYREETAWSGARRVLDLVQKALNSRVCAFLADTSYGVYLLQSLVILPLGGWWALHPGSLPMGGKARYLAALGIVMAIVYPLAYLLHRFVERPGIRVGKQFIRHRRNPGTELSPAALAAATSALPATVGDAGT